MKLFYRRSGIGPYLIILHGLYGSSDNWISISRRLSDIFTVILPDQRNHGLSPHSDIHNYNALSEDLFELTEELKIERFVLAGHSMGGKTAMNFALRWPEKLDGLLVADISPLAAGKNAEKEYRQHTHILNAIIAADLSNASRREEVESLISGSIPSRRIRELIMKNLQRNPDRSFRWKLNAQALLSNLDSIMGEIDPEHLYSKSVTGFPVVFLKGGLSDYISHESFEEIRKIFQAADFREIMDAGHWIQTDRPDEVINNLRSFIWHNG